MTARGKPAGVRKGFDRFTPLLDQIAVRLVEELPGPDGKEPAPTIPELGRRYGLDAHDTDTTLRRALDGLRRQGVVERIVDPDRHQVRRWRLTGQPVPQGQRPGRPPDRRS